MKRKNGIGSALSLCLAATLAVSAAADEASVAAVVASNTGPYAAALEGFREGMGPGGVAVFDLSHGAPSLPSSAKVVVAFGGKAAMENYPEGTTLIYCLAPGTWIDPAQRKGQTVMVSMETSFQTIILELKEIQPNLKRLAVLWGSAHLSGLAKSRRVDESGVRVLPVEVTSSDELPDVLRGLEGRVDAVWLMADPLLLNEQNVRMIKEFCWANKLPVYSSVKRFLDYGSVAAVYVDFGDIGRAAANAARRALAGESLSGDIASPRFDIAFNMTAAGECGVNISEDLKRRATAVAP
ncbi:MAG TPA: ABC transporter substrate binding protein [Elusimicrobiota bacterium]|nr:ABC transporter substrate binding protein [Elusimicrobiota bacterium]